MKPHDEIHLNQKTETSDQPATTTTASKPSTPNITITHLPAPTPEIYVFALSAWTTLFSPIAPPTLRHQDLPTFTETYTPPNGRILVATAPSHPNTIIGTIGYRTYDNRFAHLGLSFPPSAKAVEVVRLFVEPAWRGQGVASKLIRELVEVVRADGARTLYLHTHPFLPGAKEVWERQGWGVVVREEGAPWWTIHMRRDLR